MSWYSQRITILHIASSLFTVIILYLQLSLVIHELLLFTQTQILIHSICRPTAMLQNTCQNRMTILSSVTTTRNIRNRSDLMFNKLPQKFMSLAMNATFPPIKKPASYLLLAKYLLFFVVLFFTLKSKKASKSSIKSFKL